MQVQHWTGDYLPNAGGIAAHVAGLALGIARSGAEVNVIVPSVRRNPFARAWRVDQTDLVTVMRASIARRPWESRASALARFVNRWRRDPARSTPDVLHWHTPVLEGELAGLLAGRVKIFTNHTSQFLEWQCEGRDRAQARRALAAADAVICPSHELASATVDAGFPPAHVHVISNGVDTERFSPEVDGTHVRRALGIHADEVLFLCPRRLEKKNGVPFWLHAIRLVLASGANRVRFLLVGDYATDDVYSDRRAVIDALASLPVPERVAWVGSVAPSSMPGYVAAADVVVLPSLMEATSIAALEAMACGKALIATAVGGLPELIEHSQSGLLVPPRDSAALAAAMNQLAENPQLRRWMGELARARSLHEFSWGKIAQRTIDVYEAELSDRSTGRRRGLHLGIR